jgi:hypothetical protein
MNFAELIDVRDKKPAGLCRSEKRRPYWPIAPRSLRYASVSERPVAQLRGLFELLNLQRRRQSEAAGLHLPKRELTIRLIFLGVSKTQSPAADSPEHTTPTSQLPTAENGSACQAYRQDP